MDSGNLIVHAPRTLTIRLPAALVVGGELVLDASLAPRADGQGSVQVQWFADDAETPLSAGLMSAGLLAGEPVLTAADTPARHRVGRAYEEFRQIFPASMCHARIVPVDAVVTLVLYHREDDHLVRLMLDEAAAARLDRLWDELHFVSQDALQMEVALEQRLEFATQGGDPAAFDPTRKPVAENAAAFRQQLLESESAHHHQLLQFAARAYRRPLYQREKRRLRDLYASLREGGEPHEQAFRQTLASVFVSPAFLYRLEQPGEGSQPTPVSAAELATRLSYFLWSSMPDRELRTLASSGELTQPATLVAQARRMLGHDNARRLAVEFACQWLHLRDSINTIRKTRVASRSLPICATTCMRRRSVFLRICFATTGRS